MTHYKEPTKEISDNTLAWRTGGMRYLLGLMIREFGYEKVKRSLEIVNDENNLF